MVIVEKNKENKIRFDEIDVGDVFKSDNEFFMKIFSEVGDVPDNAVSLRTGICELFEEYDVIEIVNNAKMVIG